MIERFGEEEERNVQQVLSEQTRDKRGRFTTKGVSYEFIVMLYTMQSKSTVEISRITGLSRTQVKRILGKLDVRPRTMSENMALRDAKFPNWRQDLSRTNTKYFLSKDDLSRIIQSKSFKIPKSTVYRLLRKHGIVAPHSPKHFMVKEMTPVECAWLSCAIDSEGTIMIFDGKYKTVSLSIANTDENYINYIVMITGVDMKYKSPKRKPNHKPLFTWKIGQHEVVKSILRQVLPYMIVKKNLAEAVLND